jgi:hypothetical protein
MWFVLAYHVYTNGFKEYTIIYYCRRKFLPFCLVYTAFPSGFLCIHSVARPCFVYENRGGTPKQYPPRNETE